MNNLKILLFSNFDLPTSNADAIRVFNFAKMLKEQGCETIIYGVTYEDKKKNDIFEGLNYTLLKVNKSRGIKSYFRIKNMEKQIKLELNKLKDTIGIDAIVLSNIYFDCAKTFLKFSKDNGIPLIVNSVEWYDRKDELFNGIYGPLKLLKNRMALKYIHVKMNNIIAISTLLGNYYKSKNCNTITIPTIVDFKHYKDLVKTHEIDEKIKLCYAGSPAKKDIIINFIYALLQMDSNALKNFELHLYGFNVDALYKYGITHDEIHKLKNVLFCHGRIPYSEVKEKISNADYTILVRPQKRYANAGFPTKVGESFACGTPVISNITSDLGKYIVDMKNSVVCKDETIASCKEALLKTLNILPREYLNMRNEALISAMKYFSYQEYSKQLYEFIIKAKMEMKNNHKAKD